MSSALAQAAAEGLPAPLTSMRTFAASDQAKTAEKFGGAAFYAFGHPRSGTGMIVLFAERENGQFIRLSEGPERPTVFYLCNTAFDDHCWGRFFPVPAAPAEGEA